MTHEEMRHLIALELICPSEYDKNLIEIPQDIRDQMYEKYKHNESLTSICSIIPNEKDRNRMLELAKLIDDGIEKERISEQEEQNEKVSH